QITLRSKYVRPLLWDLQNLYTILHGKHRKRKAAENSPGLLHYTYFLAGCSSTVGTLHPSCRLAKMLKKLASFLPAPHYLPTRYKVAKWSLLGYRNLLALALAPK